MKKNTTKTILISALAAILIVGAVLLISALNKDAFGNNWFARNKTIATVGGEKVKMGQFARLYGSYYQDIENRNLYASWGLGGKYYDTSVVGWEQELKEDIFNELISQIQQKQKAIELGITLSDEERKDSKASGQTAVEEMEKQCLKSAEEAGATDAKSYAVSIMNNYLRSNGMTKAQYRKENVQNAIYTLYQNKLREHCEEEFVINEEDLPGVYEELVQTAFVDAYKAGDYTLGLQSLRDEQSAYPSLYIPENFLFVRAIDAGTSEEDAQAMLARIEGGESFETIRLSMENKDDFMCVYPDPIALGPDDSFMGTAAYEQALEMGIGAYAITANLVTVPVPEDADPIMDEETGEPVTTTEETHYYVIRRVESQTGMVPYEKYAAALKDGLIMREKNRLYGEMLESWLKDASVSRRDDLVQNVIPPTTPAPGQ